MLDYSKKNSFISILLALLIISACGGSTTITPSAGTSGQAELVSISISPTDAVIALGTVQNFAATGLYSDNTTQDLTAAATWDSSDTSQATFLAPGHIQGRVVGKITVTARFGRITGSTTLTVTDATLSALEVTPNSPSIANGTSQQFIATGIFSDNSTQDMTTTVTWSSSNTGIASINNTSGSYGLSTAISAGSTTIVATYNGITGSTSMTVTSAVLVSLAISPTNPSIALGTAQQFTATGTFSDNTTQNLTASVSWGSSSTGVSTVSNTSGSKGLATSVATGATIISATMGNITGSTGLTVTSATLVSIALTPSNPSVAAGNTLQFTATGTYSNGSTQNVTAAATWTSSDTGKAAVSNAAGTKGLATTSSAGSTIISAAVGSVKGSTTLTVTAASLISIAVAPSGASIAAGTTQQFTATGTYSNGATQNITSSVTWASSNTARVTISNASGSKGLATAVAAGSATISATSGSVAGSTTLTTTAATLTSIAVTPANPSITDGDTQQFMATGTYSNGSTQDLTASVTWTSSNTNVATVSNAAGSQGLGTAISAGACNITAASGTITGQTTLTVTSAGSFTLTWDAPSTYTDGSFLNPLTDLASYKIYYGISSHLYSHSMTITNPGTSTVSRTLTLPSGTYYLAVTCIDTLGLESNYSNEVIKVAQ
jgi:hypothetical protein